MKKNHLDGLSIILLVILCVSWGLQNVAIKLTAADISPVMQSGLRSVGASLLVVLLIILRRKPLFEADGTLWWGIAAGVLFGAEFLLVYWGLEFTNASRAVIFLYMSPFIVAIGSQIFIPNEKLNKLQYIGLTSAFLGIVIAFGESFTLPSDTMLIGDAMLILAAVLWGATTVLIKASPLSQITPSKTLLYQLVVSAPMLLVGSWMLNEPGIVQISEAAIISLLYQTVWIATVTYLVWFWLVRHYPAPKLTSFHFLTPLFGVLAGVVILDEPLTPALSIAAVFVAIGIYLVNKPPKKEKEIG